MVVTSLKFRTSPTSACLSLKGRITLSPIVTKYGRLWTRRIAYSSFDSFKGVVSIFGLLGIICWSTEHVWLNGLILLDRFRIHLKIGRACELSFVGIILTNNSKEARIVKTQRSILYGSLYSWDFWYFSSVKIILSSRIVRHMKQLTIAIYLEFDWHLVDQKSVESAEMFPAVASVIP